MLSSARGKPRQHWEDPLLLHVVNDDLLGKDSWSNLRPVLLELPPCRCDDRDETPSSCQQRRSDDETWTSREHSQCSCNTAHGIAATVVEGVEDDCSPSAAASITAAVVVFAVNAGCPLPTRRFCDVVSAAEEHLRLHDQGHDQGDLQSGLLHRIQRNQRVVMVTGGVIINSNAALLFQAVVAAWLSATRARLTIASWMGSAR